MFYQDKSLDIVKESLVFVMMLLLLWRFIKTYNLSLSRNLLYLSWCSCCHDVLSRHITCHGQWIFCICHDAPVMMFHQDISCHCQGISCIGHNAPLLWCFIKTNNMSSSRNLLYLSWCSYWHVLSRQITCHCQEISLSSYSCYYDVLSRHITCHWHRISCNCHDAAVVMFYQNTSLVIVKISFVIMSCGHDILSRHITCHYQGLPCICHDASVAMVFIKTYHLSLTRNLL